MDVDTAHQDMLASEGGGNIAGQENRPKLHPLKYGKLDFEKQEVRILVLQPVADSRDAIDCLFPMEPSLECDPYTAVIDTRGSNLVREVVLTDGFGKVVKENFDMFLRHIRPTDSPQRLWSHDVCPNLADVDERDR